MLPALVLAAFNVGLLTRYTRSAVLEVIDDGLRAGGAGRKACREHRWSDGTCSARRWPRWSP